MLSLVQVLPFLWKALQINESLILLFRKRVLVRGSTKVFSNAHSVPKRTQLLDGLSRKCVLVGDPVEVAGQDSASHTPPAPARGATFRGCRAAGHGLAEAAARAGRRLVQ